MNYKDTIEILEHLHHLFDNGADDSVLNATQKRQISAIYKSELQKPIAECNCKNKYKDAIVELLLLLRNRNVLNEERKYKMKSGYVIWLDNNCYSSANITDEIAEKWLTLHPDGKRYFVLSEERKK